MLLNINKNFEALFCHSLTELKLNTLTLKAGPLPGYTKVTWLSKISWRTILSAEAGPHHPRPYLTPQCKMWAEAGNDSVLSCPWHWRAGLWKLDWLRLSIVSLLRFMFLLIVLWNVLGVQLITRIVQPITRRSRFRSGVLKIQRIEEFSMGFEGNGKFKKYILQPRAHNSILPMSVDTLQLSELCDTYNLHVWWAILHVECDLTWPQIDLRFYSHTCLVFISGYAKFRIGALMLSWDRAWKLKRL